MKNLVKISFLAMYLVAALPAFAFAQTTYPATMSFSPSSGSVVANPNFTVDVVINTGTATTTGADAVVKFDATKVQFISAARPTSNDFYGGTNHTGQFIPYTVNASTGTVEIGHAVLPGTLPANYPAGTGSIATLTFKPLVAIGQTVTLNLDFTAAGATTDSNVISSTGTDLLGSVSSAILTIAAAPPVPTTPTIISISPTSGDQNVAQTVTITGTNFDTQGTNSKVYIGTNLTTVTSWNATQIVVQIPTQPQLTTSSTWQIKVHRHDGAEATSIGYTYIVAGTPPAPTPTPLPDNGPEVFSYFGLAMSAFGMAGLTYLKLFSKTKATDTSLAD